MRALALAGSALGLCADLWGWKDKDGTTCVDYVRGKWCGADGGAGEAWEVARGTEVLERNVGRPP